MTDEEIDAGFAEVEASLGRLLAAEAAYEQERRRHEKILAKNYDVMLAAAQRRVDEWKARNGQQ